MRHALVLSLVLLTFVAAPAQVAAPPQVTGILSEVDGMRVLSVWGDWRERGHAQGVLLGAEIMDLVENFALSPKVSMGKPQIWDLMIKPTCLSRFEFPKEARDFAAGVIEGLQTHDADLRHIEALDREIVDSDILVCSCIPDLVGLMCSSFVAWGEVVAGDAHLVGRNLDYFSTPALTKHTMLVVHAPQEGEHGWVSVSWPAIFGCLTGFSDAGVSLAIHDVYVKAEKGKDKFTPRIIALQQVLVTAEPGPDTASKARDFLAARRFTIGGNGMLAWSSQEHCGGAVLEFDGRKSNGNGATTRGPDGSNEWVVCSNHHRLRSEQGHDCRRFADIAGRVAGRESSMDFAAGWKTIESASVGMTLYRTMADLRSGRLEVDRRTSPTADFAPRARFNIKKLIQAAHAPESEHLER
ncbi:MAG: hypothetical protein KDB53_11550 [Planctomycetes bacterium]|nr:hypothetical protein [Planctomycetota bacterium]